MPKHTANLLRCWIRRGGSMSQKRWWKTVPACIWWNIWRERNPRIFKREECSLQKIKWKVISFLCFWCEEQNIEDEIQLVDFLGSSLNISRYAFDGCPTPPVHALDHHEDLYYDRRRHN